ncbi:MAG: hypothetical protein KAV18_04940, partial [Candidatus Omnitrophica bacterium]|nr:hypothetical protein [Candidatus Omnitrophota bacterium]
RAEVRSDDELGVLASTFNNMTEELAERNDELKKEKNRVVDNVKELEKEIIHRKKAEEKIEKSLSTIIVGEKGELDSLGLVNFIVAVEDKIKNEFKAEVSLSLEELMSNEENHLNCIETFVEYMCSVLEDKINE